MSEQLPTIPDGLRKANPPNDLRMSYLELFRAMSVSPKPRPPASPCFVFPLMQLFHVRVLEERGPEPVPVENSRRVGPAEVLRVPLPETAGAAEDDPQRRVRGRDARGRGREHHPDRVQGVCAWGELATGHMIYQG